MAHFAKIDENNVVTQVIVVVNEELLDNGVESEAKGIAFCQSLFGGDWVQTSYNSAFRNKYAGIGYVYDLANDVFIAPRPFASWVLNENFDWQPPIAKPTDDKIYKWDESIIGWREVGQE